MTSTASSERSTCSRQASSGSLIAVRPGVATSWSTQRRRSSSLTRDDDESVGLDTLARGLHARKLLQPQVDDLALDRRHRLQLGAPLLQRTLRGPNGHRLERGASPIAIAGRIDDDVLRTFGPAASRDGVREVLDRVDRLPVLADQQAELRAAADDVDRLLVLPHVDPTSHADPLGDTLHELTRL